MFQDAAVHRIAVDAALSMSWKRKSESREQ
jgi:hypothetical protein